jgi:predicted acetyltransferase
LSQIKNIEKIKRIPKKEYAEFVDIGCNAYPGMGIHSADDKKRLLKRLIQAHTDPVLELYGLYEKAKLRGGLRLFDFTMNVFSTWVPTGGGGFLAVDLVHKKEKVARELMNFFIRHYRDRGYPLAALYPFRPDFYRKMGFGYGTKVNKYLIKPSDLPRGNSKKHIRSLKKEDFRAMHACYDRYAAKTHGMFKRCKYESMRLGWQNVQIVGYVNRNRIEGYVVFSFKSGREDNFIFNDIHISEFIYENREAFSELMTFLHTQADQINQIVFPTQHDYFHYLPLDPRNGTNNMTGPVAHETNAQGIGIMYRVLDIPGLFRTLRKHSFGDQDLKLKLTVVDSFLKENSGSYYIHFVDGKPHLKRTRDFEVEIELDVADFSSLVLGTVDFGSLYEYRLAEISNIGYLTAVTRLFQVEVKPECTTQF